MQKTLFLLAAAFLGYTANAQKLKETEVPQPVKTTIQNTYPEIKKIKWEKERDLYEGEFELKGVEYALLCDSTGKIREIEVEISIDKLPFEVMNYMIKNYPGQKFLEITSIAADGAQLYEIEVKGKELVIDASGKLVREILKDD